METDLHQTAYKKTRRIYRLATFIALAVVLVGLQLITDRPASAETFTGRATVVDGDTIEIHGKRMRLL